MTETVLRLDDQSSSVLLAKISDTENKRSNLDTIESFSFLKTVITKPQYTSFYT